MKLSMQKLTRINSLILLFICFSIDVAAQTIFSYGKRKVSKEDFVTAYEKNNTDTTGGKISYNDYLDLYIKFRLKVQAAIDEGIDTTAEQLNELKNFRSQLADSYMREEASIKLLTEEAIERSKKDLKIAIDGKEVGWITAFVLPYAVENIAYSTPVGKTSNTFTTSSGTHTLTVLEERRNIGEIRVAQILFGFKPNATEKENHDLALLADSVYKALNKGADFVELVEKYSHDMITLNTKGEIPAFGPGKYDPDFEKQAFSLVEDGEISRPFKTAFGYHILKRTEHLPFKDSLAIHQLVLSSDRMEVAQKVFVKKAHDIILNEAAPENLVNDSAVLSYYKNNLEKYNQEFAHQLNEFKEGNLLFAIMQKKVWDKASDDSVSLVNYYNAHQSKYQWEISADAVLLTMLNPINDDQLTSDIEKNIHQWRDWVDKNNTILLADSGRFELSQLPVIVHPDAKAGTITQPVYNEQEGSKTAAYVVRLYTNKESKDFEDARGAVINDYQQLLEEEWVASLKKKYPVKINKKLLKKLN